MKWGGGKKPEKDRFVAKAYFSAQTANSAQFPSWEASCKASCKTKFIDKPLSNFKLLEWIDYLRVPNFKRIFSRDCNHHLHETGSCIINLDDEIGHGTHWVATYITGNFIYYFDSFSLPPLQEFVDYAEK